MHYHRAGYESVEDQLIFEANIIFIIVPPHGMRAFGCDSSAFLGAMRAHQDKPVINPDQNPLFSSPMRRLPRPDATARRVEVNKTTVPAEL